MNQLSSVLLRARQESCSAPRALIVIAFYFGAGVNLASLVSDIPGQKIAAGALEPKGPVHC
jgi:hypothetical protein